MRLRISQASERHVVVAGETLLEEVVLMSAKVGLVRPHDHIVCVQRMGESFVIKIVSVNAEGDGVEIIRPKSLLNLMQVRPPPLAQFCLSPQSSYSPPSSSSFPRSLLLLLALLSLQASSAVLFPVVIHCFHIGCFPPHCSSSFPSDLCNTVAGLQQVVCRAQPNS